MGSKLEILKKALKIDDSLIWRHHYFVHCPDCYLMSLDDPQYSCTTCDGSGTIDLIATLYEIVQGEA